MVIIHLQVVNKATEQLVMTAKEIIRQMGNILNFKALMVIKLIMRTQLKLKSQRLKSLIKQYLKKKRKHIMLIHLRSTEYNLDPIKMEILISDCRDFHGAFTDINSFYN
jgi:hypothetical protein